MPKNIYVGRLGRDVFYYRLKSQFRSTIVVNSLLCVVFEIFLFEIICSQQEQPHQQFQFRTLKNRGRIFHFNKKSLYECK